LILFPAGDWRHISVIVSLHQFETVAVQNSGSTKDDLDTEVKAVEYIEKLCEDTAGSVAVFETAHCQDKSFIPLTREKYSLCLEGGGSTFRFRMIEAVRPVLVTVVRPQVEVYIDLPPARKALHNVPLKQRIAESLGRLVFELLAEVVQNRAMVG